MTYVIKIIKGIDKLVEKVAKFSAWLFIPLVLTLVYEVTARYAFNAPTSWSFEITYFLSSFLLVMGMSYTMQVKQHVTIDVFYNNFSPRTRAIIDIVSTLLLFLPLWLIVLYFLIPYAYEAFVTGERNQVG